MWPNPHEIQKSLLEEAEKAEYATTTWRDLMSFNNKYMSKLDVSS